MKLEIRTDPPPLREDLGGVIRVGPTRVTLEAVVNAYKRGESPEEIVEAFDTLQLAVVYSVIGYYLRHKTGVDAYVQWAEAEAEAIRRKIESSRDIVRFASDCLHGGQCCKNELDDPAAGRKNYVVGEPRVDRERHDLGLGPARYPISSRATMPAQWSSGILDI